MAFFICNSKKTSCNNVETVCNGVSWTKVINLTRLWDRIEKIVKFLPYKGKGDKYLGKGDTKVPSIAYGVWVHLHDFFHHF